MELFEKIYGCYYQAVNQILSEAANHSITKKRLEAIAGEIGFQESALTIVPKLTDKSWALLKEAEHGSGYASALSHQVKVPMTTLQKSWLKSLSCDPRIRLFLSDQELADLESSLDGIEGLYSVDDFFYFDQYEDGDPFDSARYREIFHTILEAFHTHRPLIVAYANKGDTVTHEVAPYHLQYSAKDDKFRLCALKYSCHKFDHNIILNLARIEACHLSIREIPKDLPISGFRPVLKAAEPVVIEIDGQRNSLERCMLHFANYEKHTEYEEKRGVYLCSIYYDMADETELLIEILSFGPVIRVLGPDHFLSQIRQRVQRQHDLLY